MKLKLCGIFRPEDVMAINQHQCDYVGFVFYPPSHRYVTIAQAKQLRQQLDKQIATVGVFVDAKIATISDCVNQGIISLVQLHGHEDATYIKQLQASLKKPVKIIKAINIKSARDFDLIDYPVDYYLLDSKEFGSGKSFDWSWIKKLNRPYFIAGGISQTNLQAALKLGAYGIDISSGIETNRVKDPRKIAEIVRMVKMEKGRYGKHGGQYIPETLMNEIHHVEESYEHYKNDPDFQQELQTLLVEYASRPSLLYYASKMTKDLGGAKVYLKREDLNHTGSHKINNVLGQVLMAKKMGKTRVIAETGAGQHGVATATAAALLDMECVIFMGEEDTIRQALNVYRMELLGAKVVPVTTGTKTLKDAVNEAMREWTKRIDDTMYVLGSVMGPHPFPMMVRDFQAVISKEAREQILAKEGRLPNVVMACVGGGSNAMGMFYNFINDSEVQLIGCEAAGKGIHSAKTAATINTGTPGVFHGMKSYFCQDEYGQIAPVYSISAGLDYPGIGPEHAHLHDIKRASYVPVTDDEAVAAFEYLAKTEGIVCAIESAHAVAHAMKIVPQMNKDEIVIICLSGRGDKDVAAIARYKGVDLHD